MNKIKLRNTDNLPRLLIKKTLQHLYAQLIQDNQGGMILCSLCTLNREFKEKNVASYNREGARLLGKIMAKKIFDLKIENNYEVGMKHKIVVLDSNKYKYEGRIKDFFNSFIDEINNL